MGWIIFKLVASFLCAFLGAICAVYTKSKFVKISYIFCSMAWGLHIVLNVVRLENIIR